MLLPVGKFGLKMRICANIQGTNGIKIRIHKFRGLLKWTNHSSIGKMVRNLFLDLVCETGVCVCGMSVVWYGVVGWVCGVCVCVHMCATALSCSSEMKLML